MQHQTHKAKLSYQDFLLFPEDGKRHELLGGDHLVTPSPSTKHQRVSRNLMCFMDSYLRRSKAGEVFAAPMDVVLSDLDVVEPDLLFISREKSSIITEKNIQGSPDLVIEIVSKSTQRIDSLVKRKLYERCGIQEYWLVDPELKTVDVCRLANGKYVRQAALSQEDDSILKTPLMPGFQLRLSDIFS